MDWPGHISKSIMDTYFGELDTPDLASELNDITYNWICASRCWLKADSEERRTWVV